MIISASALPLPWGVGCVLGPSHFGQRPRVDGILIDEMSCWDKPRQVIIEFRDTTQVGLSKEGFLGWPSPWSSSSPW